MSSAAMSERPGWVLRRVVWPVFRPIAFAPEAAESLRQAADAGPLVYVLRSVSYVDFLYFNYAFLRYGLPLARFVNGLWSWVFATLPAIARALWRRVPAGARQEQLRRALDAGHAAMLFLRRPLGLAPRRKSSVRGNYVATLIAQQRAHPEARLQLVPLVLIWGRSITRPGGPKPSFLDRLFGAQEEPGWLRSLLQFLRYRGSAVVRVGEPVDLTRFLEENDGIRDDVLARRLRFLVSGQIERERRAFLGPPRKTTRRIREEVLRSRDVREVIASQAQERGIDQERVVQRAREMVEELAADMKPWGVRFLYRLLQHVFSRIYDGVEVDQEGMARVRDAARRGPLLLCPCHRSHIDYLVLSCVFIDHELVPPHIAAGVNLTFFPAGQIFRRGGAFFLRRSFRGDLLYATVFNAYVRKMLREGYNIEFFIEGTRSRVGKLLPPRTGLLRVVAEAALAGAARNLRVVPISIGYEKVIEERSYTEELAGGQKRSEDMGALFRAGRVLGSRYGRLNIQYDEPFDFAAALEEAGATPGCDEETLREAVARLAHHIVYRISRVTAVTPTTLVAAALLASGRRGVTRANLIATCGLLAQRARRQGARFPSTLTDEAGPHGLRVEAIDRALDLLSKDRSVDARGPRGEEIYVIPEERRAALDYYKSNALHYWTDESLVALVALTGTCGNRVALKEGVLELSRLLKREFVYRQDGFDRVFDETLGGFTEAGWLEADDEGVRIAAAGREPLPLLAGLTRHYVEAYHAAVTALKVLRQGPRSEREAVRLIHAQAERLFLTGDLSRREACTRQLYVNALKVFAELGWVERKEDQLHLAPGVDLREQAALVARFLEWSPPGLA